MCGKRCKLSRLYSINNSLCVLTQNYVWPYVLLMSSGSCTMHMFRNTQYDQSLTQIRIKV